MFKRLFPVFLATILLAGWATAQAAGPAKANRNPTAARTIPVHHYAPGQLRLDFGTVVRDTADEQRVGPGHWQAPREASPWTSFFSWSWFNLLMQR